jgi:hypothetical protein
MGKHRPRDVPPPLVEIDVPVQPVHRPRSDSAEGDRDKEQVFEHDIGRQREEIEADVLAEDGLALAVGRLEDEAQENIPIAGLEHGDRHSDKAGDEREKQFQVRAPDREGR